MSREAQRAVLGAAILDSGWAMEAVNALSPEMFEAPLNREIFEKITGLYWSGKPVDLVTLAEALPEGYKEYMWQMAHMLPTLSHTAEYIRIVQEDWQRDKLLGSLSEMAMTGGASVGELLDGLDSLVQEHRALQAAARQEGVMSFSQAADEFLTWLQGRDDQLARRTGMEQFDRVTGGFQPGTVFTLAARPGCGKTDFALNLALCLAKNGVKCLYFSLEMTNLQMMQRVASRAMQVNSILIRDNALGGKEKAALGRILEGIKSGDRLGFVEEPRVSVGKVAHYIDLWKPDVVFIDHIGLMARPKANSDYRALGMVSNQLKALAKKKNVAVVQLSQMNRQIEGRKGGRPTLSDLRESGDLEQDSDVVAFLTPQKAPGEKISGDKFLDVELYFAKIRDGDQGAALRFKWQPQYHKYTEVEGRYG